MKRPIFALLFLLLLLPSTLLAQEVIKDYFSEIEIATDGSMIVEEQITVHAEGKKIKRGIYRDFPTDYEDALGNQYRVDFDVLGVWRDDSTEDFHTEKRGNEVRLYIGNKNVFLQPGTYTYKIRYRTNRQLGFFDQHDELYWNVTGNGWNFTILQAGARVHLPSQPPTGSLRLEAYTGLPGERGRHYQSRITQDGDAIFHTTRPLVTEQGLTIVVGWPKGIVTEPTSKDRAGYFFADNRDGLTGTIGLLLLLGYYLLVWRMVGKDPDKGVVIPLYAPPQGHSPAAMRFMQNMGYDHEAFSAAVVNMAVEGYLTIEQGSDGIFTLKKTGQEPKLAAGERAIARALFSRGKQQITLVKGNHSSIGKAVKAHERSLKRFYESRYFITNRSYLIPGILLTIILFAVTLLANENGDAAGAAFMMLWLSIWSIAVFKMVQDIFQRWIKYFHGGSGTELVAVVAASLFALPFIGGEIMGIGMLLTVGSPALIATLIAGLTINYLFYEWMKAPTLAGQKLAQEIEGFKLYLTVAEQDALNYKHPKEKTPELFESYLPYALALGVEQQWGDYFSNELKQANQKDDDYHPHWYHGNNWSSSNMGSFGQALGGAMSSAISSSSTAPGSSSGFSGGGGGGSSGGGGGGGGGGGW